MKMILAEFNQRFTKEIHKTQINEINFYWEFYGFPKIINTDNLITFIENKFKITYNKIQQDDLVNKIELLRKSIDLQVITDQHVKNKINNFLMQSYTLIRDFINHDFFAYIFYNYAHEEIWYQHSFVDIDDFYELRFKKLQQDLNKIKTIFLTTTTNKKALE